MYKSGMSADRTRQTTSIPSVSIFPSLDGEVNGAGQGVLATFIRLAGCNLRCWGGRCDTPQGLAVTEHTRFMQVSAVIDAVVALESRKVTVTGGEPLLYAACGLQDVLAALADRFIYLSVETNGSILPPEHLLRMVDSWVVDHKCPSTGESGKMVPFPIMRERLTNSDFIKFVIADEDDYAYAKNIVESCVFTPESPNMAFSPKTGGMNASWLADRLVADRLHAVRYNLQIHKVIWPEADREV
jgi:7-carboxy-7-deazaguanine synthase